MWRRRSVRWAMLAALGVGIPLAGREARAQVYVSDTYQVARDLYIFDHPFGANPYGPMSTVLPGKAYGVPVPRRPLSEYASLRAPNYNRLTEMDRLASHPGEHPDDYRGEPWWMASPFTLMAGDVPAAWYAPWNPFPFAHYRPEVPTPDRSWGYGGNRRAPPAVFTGTGTEPSASPAQPISPGELGSPAIPVPTPAEPPPNAPAPTVPSPAAPTESAPT